MQNCPPEFGAAGSITLNYPRLTGTIPLRRGLFDGGGQSEQFVSCHQLFDFTEEKQLVKLKPVGP